MIGFLNRNNQCCIIGFTYYFKLLIHGQSFWKNQSVRPQIVVLSTFLYIHWMKSIFTTVKWPKKGLVLASSLSRVWIGPKVFVPRVGKHSDRLINRAWNPVGVLDQSLLFCISPANPIILEVTKGTTKIDDPSIRPKGGIPINSNHPSRMPLSIPSGCLPHPSSEGCLLIQPWIAARE